MNNLKRLCVLIACLAPAWAQSYDDQLTRSRVAMNEKRYKDAQSAAEQAIKLDQNRWEGYAMAASAYSSQKLFDDAIGMLQLALPRAPEDRKQLIRDALAEARKQLAAPAPTAATAPTQAEIVLWKTIETSSNAADFQAYLRQYPNGAFAVLAKARLQALTDAAENTTRGVWVDPTTKLMWPIYFSRSLRWSEATNYCRNLPLAGFRDWRLPDIEELKEFPTARNGMIKPPVTLVAYQDRMPKQSKQSKSAATLAPIEGDIQDKTLAWSATKNGLEEAWVFSIITKSQTSRKLDIPLLAICVRRSGE
jgi:tetratricopeptide (TPR) repeat protein